MVLTAYFGLSPVTGLFCHRHWQIKALCAPGRARTTSANLTPASGRQDHTTSPSAASVYGRYRRWSRRSLGEGEKAPFVNAVLTAHGKPRPALTSRARHCHVHRIPFRVRDDRDTPLCGTGRRGYKVIWVGRKPIFRKFR